MAYRVHEILEEMVPSLRHYEKHDVFSRDEIRGFMKKREQIEYRLCGSGAEWADFERAIQLELQLEQQRATNSSSLKPSKYDDSITRRIVHLYQRAWANTRRNFKARKQIISEFVSFVTDAYNANGKYRLLARFLGKVLRTYPKVEEFWVLAAEVEMRVKNIETARGIMHRALEQHPTSRTLYLAYFDCELRYHDSLVSRFLKSREADKAKQPQQSAEPPPPELAIVLGGKIPLLVFEKATAAAAPDAAVADGEEPPAKRPRTAGPVADLSFHLAFFDACAKYAHTLDIREEILATARSRFPEDATCICRSITRHLDYLRNGTVSVAQAIAGNPSSKQAQERADAAQQLYDEALAAFAKALEQPTGALLQAVATVCRTWLADQAAADAVPPPPESSICLPQHAKAARFLEQQVYQLALEQEMLLSPDMYVEAALHRRAGGDTAGALRALQLGVAAHPKATELWKELLDVTPDDARARVLREAVNAVAADPAVEAAVRLLYAEQGVAAGWSAERIIAHFQVP